MSSQQSEAVTILHVSDMQFGAHHRFGEGLQSLASRLIQDLEGIGGRLPRIDLIVLSGDFAEEGTPKEFLQASGFVEQISNFTRVGRDRVIVVPGNHDVNRKLCESYFQQQLGENLTPMEPYDPKWKSYLEFVESLHGPEAFTPERPYSLHKFESLGLVVAALNSTMKESHRDEDHYGHCGEVQLRWFAEQLEGHTDAMRVAVVHHNLRVRAGTLDSEALRDADQFTAILGPHLDLVLHGHTHDGGSDYLSDGTLVLATGSAALAEGWRPEEVGNQYQVLSLLPGSINRWARTYKPAQKRWVGDNSLSDTGDLWFEEIEVSGLGASMAAAGAEEGPAGRSQREHEPSPSDLLAEVGQVTRIDHGPGCRIERRKSPEAPWLEYLIAFSETGIQAIGAIEAGVDAQILEDFDRTVHSPFQGRSPHARSYLVHTGVPQPALAKEAASRGILLRTWTEYQNLLDLSPYTEELTRDLVEDPLYPQPLYLDQRYQIINRVGRSDPEIYWGLADTILDWLLTDEQCFGLILGDAGFGKSFLIRRIAYLLLSGRSGLVPIVVTLRSWEKNHTVVEMVSQTVVHTGVTFQLERFQHMFATGRLVLLIDGYDEFAIRVGYDRAADQLTTFLQAMGRGAKMLLTTRPSHFRSREQATSVVFQDGLSHTRHRIFELQPFEGAEQQAFLERWFTLAGDEDPEAQASRWLTGLSEVDNLPELARTPRMLSFMVSDLRIEEIEEAAQSGQTMTAAALYERLIGKWLSTESKKVGGHEDGSAQLSSDDRWAIAEHLAFVMWSDQVPEVRQALLEHVASEALDLPKFGLTMSQAAQEIGSRTLLVGEGDARRFAHQSVFEYLLARRLTRFLCDPDNWDRLGQARLSDLTAYFLHDLAPGDAERWIRAVNEAATDG
jgi:3',5'-cyclic AMP phosphodiesterase CpdA